MSDHLTIPATPTLEQDHAYLAGYRAGYMAMTPTIPLDAAVRGFYRVGYSRGEVDRCSMHAPRYPLTAAETVMVREARPCDAGIGRDWDGDRTMRVSGAGYGGGTRI